MSPPEMKHEFSGGRSGGVIASYKLDPEDVLRSPGLFKGTFIDTENFCLLICRLMCLWVTFRRNSSRSWLSLTRPPLLHGL